MRMRKCHSDRTDTYGWQTLTTLLVLVLLCSSPPCVAGFTPTPTTKAPKRFTFYASPNMDEEIDRGLDKARALLEKSKAKLLASNGNGECGSGEQLPFFAQRAPTAKPSRDGIVKFKNEETGLVTADGEKMAELSEQEEWEERSLLEVFQNEIKENEDVYSTASEQLQERDVAASIYNLRKVLQTEDYKRIFDKSNRFIGEDI